MSGRGTLKGPPVQNTDHRVKYQCVVNFHVYGWRGGAVAGAECGAMPKEAANELFWWKCGPVPRPHSYELVEESPPLWETPPGPPHTTTSPYLTSTDHRCKARTRCLLRRPAGTTTDPRWKASTLTLSKRRSSSIWKFGRVLCKDMITSTWTSLIYVR